MKQMFNINGSVYRWMLMMYNLLKLNILCIMGFLSVAFGMASVSTVLALLLKYEIKLEEIPLMGIIEMLKKNIKIPVLSQIIMVLYIVFAYYTIKFIPVSIYFFLVGFVAFMIFYFNHTLVNHDRRFHQHHLASASYLTLKYIGFFCIGLIPLVVTCLIPIFLPRLVILWAAFGFSFPLWFFTRVYNVIVKREIRIKS